MNTENYIQEKGVNIIKLPSFEDILNNLRYLISGFLLAITIVVLVNWVKLNMPNKVQIIAFIIYLLLSGWILAFTPIKNIIQSFKDFKAIREPISKIAIRIILIGLWLSGWVWGIFFLYIIFNPFFR